ncbi:glutaminase A [Pelomyxa schiedti]|nr:glutaminase A [Pelomyxa schiedti]
MAKAAAAFKWLQGGSTATVSFSCPQNKKKEDIEVVITATNFRAGFKAAAPICEGTLYAAVKPAQCKWVHKAGNPGTVAITLEKGQKGQWPSLFSAVTPGSAQPPPPTTVLFKMKANYDYDAADPFELSFKDKDIINVLSEDPSGWFKGEVAGAVGVFPSNFAERLPDEEETPAEEVEPEKGLASAALAEVGKHEQVKCRGAYTYEVAADGELGFHEGDIITVLQQDDSGWWQGELAGAIGWFPANFVTVITEKEVSQVDTKLDEVLTANTSVRLTHVARSAGAAKRRPPTRGTRLGSTVKTISVTEDASETGEETSSTPQTTPSGVGGPAAVHAGLAAAAAAIATGGPRVNRNTVALPGFNQQLADRIAARSGGVRVSTPPAEKKEPPAVASPLAVKLRSTSQPPTATPTAPPPGAARGVALPPRTGTGRANLTKSDTTTTTTTPVTPGAQPPKTPVREQPTPGVRPGVPPRANPVIPPRAKDPTAQPVASPAVVPKEPAAPAPVKTEPQPPVQKEPPPPAAVQKEPPPQKEPVKEPDTAVAAVAPSTTTRAKPILGVRPVQRPTTPPPQDTVETPTSTPASPAAPAETTDELWPQTLPPFSRFCKDLVSVFTSISPATGSPSSATPFLSQVEVSNTGFAVCSVGGSVFVHGDASKLITTQCASYPVLYTLCHEMVDEQINSHFGNSGAVKFGSKPAHPWEPAAVGASVMSAVLLNPKPSSWELLSNFSSKASMFCGSDVSFSMPAYLSSIDHANEEFARAFAMRATGNLPGNADVRDVVDFVLMVNSLQMNLTQAATYAATMANHFCCPTSKKSCTAGNTGISLSQSLAQHSPCTESLRGGAGSGTGTKWFSIGGVSGLTLLIVPDVCGVAVYSPILSPTTKDNHTSALGIEFLKHVTTKLKL